ncbi:MAG: hypothetical protein RR325_02425 [Bacilli bacterium]
MDFENPEEALIREVKRITNHDIRIIGVNPIQLFDSPNSKVLNAPLLIQERNLDNSNNELFSIDMIYLATLNESHSFSNETVDDLHYH